jgi:type III restriction enzyme
LLDTRTATTDEDKAAFNLIMRDKEQLLSFDEKVAFIFSHSALREGWDNPNIFQICTLNQAVSEVRKRQEIGRGIRLAVDETGERVTDPSVNVLTVVANESYERYVERYQEEVEADYGETGRASRIHNARRRIPVPVRNSVLEHSDFAELWEKIRHKTRYAVKVDTEALLEAVLPALDELEIRPVRVRVGKARVVADSEGFGAQTVAAPRTLAILDAESTPAQVIETMIHLLEQSSPPLRLTRRTLFEVLRRSSSRDVALANPHEWSAAAIRLIREHLSDQLVQNISYEQTGESYDLSQFRDPDEAWEDRLIPTERALYVQVEFDSDVERRFIERLENDDRTRAYVKLPRWFTVPTPVGRYNPDWAIVRERRDEHGQVLGTECFVAETKATLRLEKLRPDERRKILCGRQHFEGALGARFDVASSLSDLDLDD